MEEWIVAKGTRIRREVAVDLRPLKRCEEAQAPPRGKRVTEAKRNGQPYKPITLVSIENSRLD
ncbi:hypothetical protein ACQCT3_07875 [Sutcliffiella horikoshii]